MVSSKAISTWYFDEAALNTTSPLERVQAGPQVPYNGPDITGISCSMDDAEKIVVGHIGTNEREVSILHQKNPAVSGRTWESYKVLNL